MGTGRTYTEAVQVPIPTEPCVKCGAIDVIIDDCGYSSFNVGTVHCGECGYAVKASGMASIREYIHWWNGESERLRIERDGHLRRIAEIDAMAFRSKRYDSL